MMKLKTPKPVHFHATSFVQLQLTQIFLCSHFLSSELDNEKCPLGFSFEIMLSQANRMLAQENLKHQDSACTEKNVS